MIKSAFILLLGLLHLSVCGQLIQGRVLDVESREAIDFASVFFNGTFHGTTCGDDGSFELDATPYAGRDIQISAMGYKSYSLDIKGARNYYEVELEKAIYEISEVSVESKSLTRKRKEYLGIFRDEFLGLTKNASDCFILNEDDITFNYHSARDTLRASARKPLIILNQALGYQITYYLDRFEYDRKSKTTYFAGNIVFNMDLALSSAKREKYEEKREKTYRGSCKHFFTSLWTNSLSEEGFLIYEEQNLQPVEYKDMVIQVGGKKYFSHQKVLEISHEHFLSEVHFRGPGSYFARDGFFEPEGILWFGNMSMDRIADWLPYEYSPGQEK